MGRRRDQRIVRGMDGVIALIRFSILDSGGSLVRSHGIPEVTPDLFFAFEGLVELLNDLQQFIGIFCS